MRERGQPLLTINIEKIDFAEYQEAHRALARKINRVAPAVFGTAIFVYFFLGAKLASRDLLATGILAAYAISFLVYLRWTISRRLHEASERGNRDLPARLTFTENGVLGETQFNETFRKWEGYEGYVETEKTFTLVPTYRYYSVIPKRALDPPSLAALKELLVKVTKL